MATYVKGADTYLPDIKPFTPDYKFLSAVLETRQDKYDVNFKATNDIYNKVVYSDLSRADTRERRDQYAENIAPQIEKISGLDLSLASNVNAAKGVFAPFYDDDLTVRDMVATSKFKDESQHANNLLNSTEVDVQDRYWDVGVRAMQYKMDEFINADPDKALSMALPQYVPNANLFKMSQKMLEEMDPPLSMKMDRFASQPNPNFDPNKAISDTNRREIVNTDWIITEQNGSQVTGAALQQIRNNLMQNGSVQRAYQTQAYVRGMDWATNAVQTGTATSIEQGQELWANETIRRIEKINDFKLNQDMKGLAAAERASVSWSNYKGANGIIKDSELDQLNQEQLSDIEKFKLDIEAKKNIANEAALPSKTLNNTLNKAYNMLMQNNIMNDMQESARAWSARDYSYEMNTNPYAEKEKQFNYDMAKIRANMVNEGLMEDKKQANRLELAQFESDLENSGGNSGLGAALNEAGITLGDANTTSAAVNSSGEVSMNVSMIDRAKAQYKGADTKVAKNQIDDIVAMMQLMNPKGDNSNQDQTYGIEVPNAKGNLEEFRGTIQQIKKKLSQQNTNKEGVSTGYVNRDLISKIYSDKNIKFVDTRQQTKDNPTLTLTKDQRTQYDALYNKMNGLNGTTTQAKGVDAFITDVYKKYEEASIPTTKEARKDDDIRRFMDEGGMPNIIQDGIPLTRQQYIDSVVELVKQGKVTNINQDWEFDVGTNNADYMTHLKSSRTAKGGGKEEVFLYNADGSPKIGLDMEAINDEAGEVYDAINKELNKRLTGVKDNSFDSGDFNSARYGIEGTFTDVVSNPSYNYAINPLARNPENEQELVNLINQVKSLQRGNTPYGIGIGSLKNTDQLLVKNGLATKAYDLWIEDMNTWINNPKRSNTDAIAPIATLSYKPVFDISSEGNKTHAGYEISFSPEWLASKQKGGKDVEYGAFEKWEIKQLKGLGPNDQGSGIFIVFDQEQDINVKAAKNDYYSSTEIDIITGDNGNYHDYTVPNDNGITPTANYRVIKNGTGDYMFNYSVNYYNPYDATAENYSEYTTDSGTLPMDFRDGLRGIDIQVARMQAEYENTRINNQSLRQKDQKIYGNK